MSGHSKWSNIKRKKEKTDAQKGKIFTKIGREITVAVKEGGADPSSNSKLKDLIIKAKANNVPNDNIDRIIKKAAGDSEKNNFEEITYEGYGPCGVAVIVEALTDNRNRTAGDVRHYFDKYGGNLGQTGCVSFMFAQKGVVIIKNEGLDEEKVMEDCFEAGAVDFNFEDEIVEVFTDTAEVSKVRDFLTDKGYELESAEIEYIPSTYTRIDDEELRIKMNRLLEMLDDNDDVQNVWHNWDNEDE
ncbi:YebC/PmpR family DNA-binding transcriptional regulator [Candidatus Soleaferrea massiliensis]|uniref:YebC/PmpR family DNA-binding transcriptional regulator n=1 Tax=Candidatus Soleaferrea massiliensis TaxID=1470354 RepID=UPI00058BD278|nr:YebC/PmpR family DNA-binding transcriptional regulator [Candidatus Soleaferrea massiliensis]